MAETALIAALLDESGSMNDVRAETISGFNSFLAAVQAEQTGREAYALGWTFDHHPPNPVLRSFCDGPLADVAPLTLETYVPRGMTPLYDAIGGAITRIDALVAEKRVTKVTFLIQTDGYENSSREYWLESIRALIEARQKTPPIGPGWQIIFLGADLKDARRTGVNMGVMASNSMRYDKSSTAAMFDAVALSTSNFRTATDFSPVVELSDAAKAAFGDVPVGDETFTKPADLKPAPKAEGVDTFPEAKP